MQRIIAMMFVSGIVGCQCVEIPTDAIYACDSQADCIGDTTCLNNQCIPNSQIGPDASVRLDSGLPDAGFNPCVPNPCTDPNKGVCAANGSDAICSCDPGFHDNSGACVQDQTCLSNSCGGHGTCSDTGGNVTCSCNAGYSGSHCNTCASNYQDNDTNGTCLMACSNPSLSLNCNSHGTCNDANGTAHCVCDYNWNGPNCNDCPTGSYIDGSGHCVTIPPDAGPVDSGTPDSGLPPGPDAGEPDGGSNPCVPDPCNGHGTCSDTSGTATCACTGNWDSSTHCSSCLVGFGGANCDPLATITVTKNGGASTTLTNGSMVVLRWRVASVGGTTSIPKMAVGTVFTGPGQVTAQTLYKNGSASTATLVRFPDKIVIVNGVSEDSMNSGAYIDYVLQLTVSGVVSGNTLTVTFLGDTSATPTMVGSTGSIYNTVGSTLYASADGLCSADPPNFVYAGVAHTAPSLTCPIVAGSGTPDYSTGFQAGTWSVSNTLIAP